MAQEYDIWGLFISPEAKAELNAYMAQLEQASALLAKINNTPASGNSPSSTGSGRGGRTSSLSEEAMLIEKIAAADKKLRMQQLADYDKLIQKETAVAQSRKAYADEYNGNNAKAAAKKAAIAEKELLDFQKRQAAEDALDQRNKEKRLSRDAKIAMQKAAFEESTLAKQAAAAAKEEGYLNQLKKSVQDLTTQYMRLNEEEFKNARNNVVGSEGKKVLDSLKAQRVELATAEQAYGNYTKNVGNYSSATKMLGINIGQVLKEAPNFAISARIGIMSLTNNLPMLAEAFKAVREEQKAMKLEQDLLIKSGALLASDAKAMPSIWSMIGKSIFGLTGIMSAAMVVMQIWGPDLIKWVGSLFEAAKATDNFSYSQKALIKVLTEAGGTAQSEMEKIIKLGIEINKFGGDADAAKKIVDEFNKTFNTHLQTIDEVKKAYPEMAKSFIQSAIAMQAAMDEIKQAGDAQRRAMGATQLLVAGGMDEESINLTKERITRLMDYVRENGLDINKFFGGLRQGNINLALEYVDDKKVALTAQVLEGATKESIAAIANLIDAENKYKLHSEAAKQLLPISAIPESPDTKGANTSKEPRDRNNEMKYLVASITKEVEKIDTTKIMFPKLADTFNLEMMAIDKVLNYAITEYEKGNITFKEFEDIKTKMYQVSSDDKVLIAKETQDKIDKIQTDANNKIAGAKKELDNSAKQSAIQLVSDLADIWSEFYTIQTKLLEEQYAKEKLINDQKYIDIELRENAGVITKKEASDEKLRLDAYVLGQEQELEKKRKEDERNSFLISQAMSIAQIWMKFAEAQQAIMVASAVISAYATPAAGASYAATASSFNLAQAITGTALAAIQTIPAFEEGGEVKETGKVLVGEKRHELWVSPNGYVGITPNTPTIMNMEAGTKIYPDLTKIDLMSIIGLSKSNTSEYDMKRLENVMIGLRKDLSTQKVPRIQTQSLFDQINNSDKISARKRGLMN